MGIQMVDWISNVCLSRVDGGMVVMTITFREVVTVIDWAVIVD